MSEPHPPTDSASSTAPADGQTLDPSLVEGDLAIDIRGLMCPLPGLRIRKALKSMQPGQTLVATCSSRLVKRIAPNAGKLGGNRFLGSYRGADGEFQLVFQKS